MRKIILGILASIMVVSVANARVTPVEDYVSQFGSRMFGTPWSGRQGKCEHYQNLYSSVRADKNCKGTRRPALDLVCYYCEDCASKYRYNSTTCPTSKYKMSDYCGLKYSTCTCLTSKYPTTSTTTGCPDGQIPDVNNYCDDLPSNTRHYACKTPSCKSTITYNQCKANTRGNGYDCKKDTSSECKDYCDEKGCLPYCEYLFYQGGVLKDCKYGCAAGKTVPKCANLCYECKTCTPCAADYDKTSCPANSECDSCTTCEGTNVYKVKCTNCGSEYKYTTCPAGTVCASCTGCDNKTVYKATGCKTGYVDLDNYWCNGALRCTWK